MTMESKILNDVNGHKIVLCLRIVELAEIDVDGIIVETEVKKVKRVQYI